MSAHRSCRLVCAAMLGAAGVATAQPANNLCSTAQVVSAGSRTNGNTTGATSDLPGNSCTAGSDTLDVWYSFTPAVSGQYLIHTNASVGLADTTLAVYDGCGGVEQGCDDDSGFGTLASMLLSLSGGQNYKIRVAGFGGAVGAFVLNISNAVIAGGHDLCASATTVSANNTYIGDSTTATSEIAETTCALDPGEDALDVWFSFTPSATAEYRIDTDGSPTLGDTTLSVWSACGGGGAQLYCDDDAGADTLSALTIVLSAGANYRIRVAGWNNSSGEFLLTIGPATAPTNPPPNNACSTAQLIAAIPATVGGTNLGATSDVPFSSCVAQQNDTFDVWYRFTAVDTSTGMTLIELQPVTGGLADSTLSVFSGCGGTQLFCDDDAGVGALSRLVVALTTGTEYWVRVAGFAGGRGTFTLSIGPGPEPVPNDTCDRATVVEGSLTQTVDNYFAATELSEPGGSCNSGAATGVQNSIWYTFTPSEDGPLTGSINDVFNVYDIVSVLYTGSCGAGSLLEAACWDEPQPQDLSAPSTGSSALTAGTQYFLVIGDWGVGPEAAPTAITINVPGAPTNIACCRGTTCVLVTPASCTGPNSLNTGAAACNAPGNNTMPCCKANYNQIGSATVQDIFDFLGGYFTGNLFADINGTGSVTVQDIFDFLGAYFAGCG